MRLSRPGLADPPASIAATLRAVAVVAGVMVLLWFLSDFVLLVFAAVLIGVMLRGLADALHRVSHIPVRPALAIVTIGVVLVAAGVAYWAGPRFVEEGRQLAGEIRQRLEELRQQPDASGMAHLLSQRASALGSKGAALIRPGLDLVRSTIGTLGSVLVVLVAAIYFAISPAMYVYGVVCLVPIGYRPRARHIMEQIAHTLRYWMIGQCIDMAVIGVLSGIGLELVGVPLALVLAVVAGLLTFVPYFGALAAAVPAIIVAATVGFSKVLWVIGVFLVCHGVEGYVVAPVVQRRTVELPPALTIMAMVLLGSAYGVLGLILATPVIAALLVFVREAYVEDVLGDADAETRPYTAMPRDR